MALNRKENTMKKMNSKVFLAILFVLLLSAFALAKNPKIISTPDAPAAVGPYSQGVKFGNMVFTSGQIALDPVSGNLVGTTTGEQTTQVMANLEAILREAKLSFDDVVMSTVYLNSNGSANFQEFNCAYGTAFGCNCTLASGSCTCDSTGVYVPPRATIWASNIPKNALVEISFIAGK